MNNKYYNRGSRRRSASRYSLWETITGRNPNKPRAGIITFFSAVTFGTLFLASFITLLVLVVFPPQKVSGFGLWQNQSSPSIIDAYGNKPLGGLARIDEGGLLVGLTQVRNTAGKILPNKVALTNLSISLSLATITPENFIYGDLFYNEKSTSAGKRAFFYITIDQNTLLPDSVTASDANTEKSALIHMREGLLAMEGLVANFVKPFASKIGSLTLTLDMLFVSAYITQLNLSATIAFNDKEKAPAMIWTTTPIKMEKITL